MVEIARHAGAGEVRAARRRRGRSRTTPGRRSRAATRSRSTGTTARTPTTTRRPTRPDAEETVAQARQGRAQRGRRRRGARRRPPRWSRPSTTRRTWRTRRWSRRLRHGASSTATVRGLGAGAEPGRRARRRRQGARPQARGEGDGHTSRCSAAASAASRSATSRIEAALLSKAMGGAPVKVVWTREDDIQPRLLPHRDGRAPRGRPRRQRQGGRVAAPQRGADDLLRTSCPIRSIRATIELGMGCVDTPFDVPNIRMESGEAAAHVADRLVPLGQQRAARLVAIQSFVAEIAHAAGQGPEGLPARADRAGADRRHRASRPTTDWWNYGEPYRDLPDRHRPAAPAWPSWRPSKAGWGKQLPKGHGLGIAAHRSFVSYIATVVEVAVDDKGNDHDPARRHRDRLRLLRPTRSACARRSRARP